MNGGQEFVDLVDAYGRVARQNVPRSDDEHVPGLHLQIVITVVFDKQKRVLVHRRALTKKAHPGDIDHACGGVLACESPEVAAEREVLEETGVRVEALRLVAQGVNKYDRYRYLFVGTSDEEPKVMDGSEVDWVCFMSLSEIHSKQRTGELTFVDDFFEDLTQALQAVGQSG